LPFRTLPCSRRISLSSRISVARIQYPTRTSRLGTCAADKKEAETILTVEAIDVLASLLRTPLQIQMHLNLALEASYQSGERPVSVEVVESVLSRQIDDLEPTLTRHGYSIKDLVEQFDSKAGEIKALFNNTLDATRTGALREKMLRAGLPI
jgi:hypothetical protein